MSLKLRIALTSIVILLSFIMGGGLYVHTAFQRMQDNIEVEPDVDEKIEFGDEEELSKIKYNTVNGITNILLVGVDNRIDGEPERSDAIMVATIDTIHKKLKLTSIMRDTYVEIPGKGSTKINHSHAYGGTKLLIKTIEENFGIPIDKYVKINFKGFKDIIDVVGGIEVQITNEEMLNELNRCLIMEKYEDPEFKDSRFIKMVDSANLLLDREEYRGIPYIKDNHHISKEDYDYLAVKSHFVTSTGEVTLNGAQALAYSRMRHNVGGSEARTGRQREVISLVSKKMSQLPITKYVKLAETIIPYVKTDISMQVGLDLAYTAVKINNLNIETLQLPPEKLACGMTVDKSFIYENEDAYVFLTNMYSTAKVAQDFILKDIPYDESKYNTFNYIEAGYYSPKKDTKTQEEIDENSDEEVEGEEEREGVEEGIDQDSSDDTNENIDTEEDTYNSEESTDNNKGATDNDSSSEGNTEENNPSIDSYNGTRNDTNENNTSSESNEGNNN